MQPLGCVLFNWKVCMVNESDKIEKEIVIQAPIERVWRALIDYQEFGKWFQVKLDQPFETGKDSTGHMTIPGYEHIKWEAQVLEIKENSLFSFTWPPYVENTDVDLSKEPWLTTVFTLTETSGGTVVKVVESGFSKLAASIRSEARTGNIDGWNFQMENLSNYVSQT